MSKVEAAKNVLCVAGTAAIISMMLAQCVDTVTAKDKKEEKIYVVRHKAYRMSSPTPEQMEAYHSLMTVMEVMR